MLLARRYDKGAVKIREIAADEELPEKFLELILLELKHARIVESTRGAQGGYRLKRPPTKIFLGEIIRTIDGPLAPFEDAESLRRHVERDKKHSSGIGNSGSHVAGGHQPRRKIGWARRQEADRVRVFYHE